MLYRRIHIPVCLWKWFMVFKGFPGVSWKVLEHFKEGFDIFESTWGVSCSWRKQKHVGTCKSPDPRRIRNMSKVMFRLELVWFHLGADAPPCGWSMRKCWNTEQKGAEPTNISDCNTTFDLCLHSSAAEIHHLICHFVPSLMDWAGFLTSAETIPLFHLV